MLKIILVVILVYGAEVEHHEFVYFDDSLHACWQEAERTIIEDDVDRAYCKIEEITL